MQVILDNFINRKDFNPLEKFIMIIVICILFLNIIALLFNFLNFKI